MNNSAKCVIVFASVADPDPNPDPPDPHVFWPPGSGSFYHHAKIVRKTLSPTIRILLSSCKNSNKNFKSYYFMTLLDFLSK
jgi:hypothetical protein